jgi:hypothetical protein
MAARRLQHAADGAKEMPVRSRAVFLYSITRLFASLYSTTRLFASLYSITRLFASLYSTT